jgi:phage/plasmid primase-like uncharacterized protein
VTRRRLDREDVLAALDVLRILERLDLPVKRAGSRLRGRRCPVAEHSRENFSVDARRGLWRCHAGCGSGDALDLVAAALGLNTRRDFGRVLEATADLLGLDPCATSTDDDRDRRRAERRRRELASDAEAARRRDDAIAQVPGAWAGLATHDSRGIAYLRVRRIDPAPLIAAGHVRFRRADGSPTVRLFDAAGRPVNLLTRQIEPAGRPKVIGRPGCPVAGSLIGAVPQIAAGSGAVVICEGATDSLVAALAWPGAVVLGAQSATAMAGLAAAAAPTIRDRGAAVRIVPDLDRAGLDAADAARAELIAAGVEARAITMTDLDGAKDLSEAWAGGWRP